MPKKSRKPNRFKKSDLTLAELKALILARFDIRARGLGRLTARIQEGLGEKAKPEIPEVIAVQKKLNDSLADLFASRLMAGKRTTPLLSSEDSGPIAALVIDGYPKFDSEGLSLTDRAACEEFIKAVTRNSIAASDEALRSRENHYTEYWRWVKTVFEVAAERDVPPIELLKLDEAADEITRRLLTMQEFVKQSERATMRFMNVDTLKKIVIPPLLDLACSIMEEDRAELERQIEAELMPKLRETAEKSRAIISTWLGEEVARIYARA